MSALALTMSAAISGQAFAAGSFTSEADFLAAVGGAPLTVESFESSLGRVGDTISYAGSSVTCNGTNYCADFFGETNLLPTLGVNGVRIGAPDTITFSFSAPVKAFGIDVRGLGTTGATNFTGVLSNGAATTFFSSYTGSDDGSLFVGFVDAAGFTSVTFSGTAAGDGIYFDRMQTSAVPEPSELALVFGGLAVVAASARRSRRG